MGKIRAEGPVGDTVIEILLKFLRGEEAGTPTPLTSKEGEDGVVRLESYGIPIAERRRGGGVVVLKLGDDKLSPVRKKHRKWLEVIAQEKEVRMVCEE